MDSNTDNNVKTDDGKHVPIAKNIAATIKGRIISARPYQQRKPQTYHTATTYGNIAKKLPSPQSNRKNY